MKGAQGDCGALQPVPVYCVPLPGYGTALPPAVLVALDSVPFAPADFASYGVACPASIQRSVARRQKEFLYGRFAAREALRALGEHAPDLPIGPAREPLWPTGIIGSITHNGRYAAAVAVRSGVYSGVGIDIESIGGSANQAAMEALVVAPGELAYLRSVAGTQPLAILLTIVFSAKESLYKAAFDNVGHFFDFSAAHVVALDLVDQSLLLIVQADLSPRFMRGTSCRIHFGFVAEHAVMTAFAWRAALDG